MVNTNPETGIRYGVIALQSLDADVAQELFYGLQAKDVTYESALKDLRAEVEGEADEIEEQISIKAHEIGGFTDREYEDFCEREIEKEYQARGYDDRDEFVDDQVEYRSEGIQIEEPEIQGTYEDVEYLIWWLGGAPILYVIKSPLIGCANNLCSPCVPNAADLDSGFHQGPTGFDCYIIPESWVRKD